jgi:hypothetical protein
VEEEKRLLLLLTVIRYELSCMPESSTSPVAEPVSKRGRRNFVIAAFSQNSSRQAVCSRLALAYYSSFSLKKILPS